MNRAMIETTLLLAAGWLAAPEATAEPRCAFKDMIDVRVHYKASCITTSGGERSCTLDGFGAPLFNPVPIGEPLRAVCTLTERSDHPDATGSCTLKTAEGEWINLFASLGPRYGGADVGDWSATLGSPGCERGIGPGAVEGEWPYDSNEPQFSGTLLFIGLDRTTGP